MAAIQDPNVSANVARVEATGAQRVTEALIGDRFSQANITGTMAAALAANSTIYAMRLNPGSSKKARIHRVRLMWTCIVAFTVPITAGRRLGIFRGATAAPTAGTALGVSCKKDNNGALSQCDSAAGGDQRISATATLTPGSMTVEATPAKIMSLSHVGAAGAYLEQIFEWDGDTGGAFILLPGELLLIRNPVAMDAAGTWQLGVVVDWTEIADLA